MYAGPVSPLPSGMGFLGRGIGVLGRKRKAVATHANIWSPVVKTKPGYELGNYYLP